MGEITYRIIKQAIKKNHEFLLEYEAKQICVDYDIPTPPFDLVKDKREAVSVADRIGYPVVLKIASRQIIHKSDAGGVLLNLKNPSDVKAAYDSITENVDKYDHQAEIEGILIQKMAYPSIEIIVGALKDDVFGQTLMLGMGGIYVEIYKDVTFAIAPIDRCDAQWMLNNLKGSAILQGYRQKSLSDIESVIKVLLNVSKLVIEHSEIEQLDLNPLIVYERGVYAVDARIVLDL